MLLGLPVQHLSPISPVANRDGTTCSFADPAFVVYSSVASFYVPFIVTLLVYAQICVVLRRRGRRTAPPHRHGLNTQRSADGVETHRQRKVPVIHHFGLLDNFIFKNESVQNFLFKKSHVLYIYTSCLCAMGFLLPLQNKCTQPEDVKLCALILKPASTGLQRKKVVSFLIQ